MFTPEHISKLVNGGLFASASEFDLAVRRQNQGLDKLIILARRNKVKIHHICLLQAREKTRIRNANKNKSSIDQERPIELCKGS